MMTEGASQLIVDRLHAIAAHDGRRELIVDPVYGRFTYGDVAEQVERLASGLRSLDIGPGDVVILQLPNWAPFLVFHLALTAIGAVTATIPIVYRDRELRSVARLTEAKAIVVPAAIRGQDFAAMAERLREDVPGLRHVIVVGAGEVALRLGLVSYEALMRQPWEGRAGGESLTAARPGLDDVTSLGFTSGTTGALKAAMFSTRVLAATNFGLQERYRLNENDRIFGCSPLGHAVGFTHALRMTLTIGGSLVLLDRWEPGRALEIIQSQRCTFIAAATPFLMDLVYHPALRERGSLSSVRLFLCGGASIPQSLMRDARQALPHTFTSPLWGMTECGGVTTCPFDAPEEKLLVTDGLPCGSMELKVVAPDGARAAPGVDGELMARGPMVTLGYFKQHELTAQHFLPDGYFRTGDQARMDEDGYIKITGRIKDLVIRGGVNISPVEIEDVLFGHPKVANVAVVGMPDHRLGERICAFIVLRESSSIKLSEVQRWMFEAGVSKQKWPERIEIVRELPMTPSGKIQKFRLRESIAESLRRVGSENGKKGAETARDRHVTRAASRHEGT